jgi:hypothetical protein
MDRWIIVLEGFDTAKPGGELNYLIDLLVMRSADDQKGIRIVLVNDSRWDPQLLGKGPEIILLIVFAAWSQLSPPT